MSRSTHQIAVTGVDQTQKTFSSIQARAAAASRRIASVMGGALAAAGAYLGARAIKGGIDELGKLSDLAMKSGTSVETLTKSALAFQVAGLDVSVETLAKSFQYLKKNTGKGGMENFFKVASEISKIEDPAKRGAELVKNFGRSGLELQPLIDGGDEAIRKMQLLTEVMPGVSQAAANAGDEAADALKIFGTGAHNLFLRVVGNIVAMWSEDFPGGVRAGALSAINYLETFFKKAKAYIARFGAALGALGGLVYDLFDKGPKTAWEVYEGTIMAASADFDRRIEAADKSRAEYVSKLKELNIDDLANAFKPQNRAAAEAAAEAAAKRAVRVTNQLMEGGSNAARRLQILGPEYQNEAKKQTEILKKIEKNTEKTADNTGESGDLLEVSDLGA